MFVTPSRPKVISDLAGTLSVQQPTLPIRVVPRTNRHFTGRLLHAFLDREREALPVSWQSPLPVPFYTHDQEKYLLKRATTPNPLPTRPKTHTK